MPPIRPPRLLPISRAIAVGFLTTARLYAVPAPTSPAPPPVASSEKIIFEEWTTLTLNGKRCGFDSTIITQFSAPGGVNFRTVAQEEFVVKRMGASLKILETSTITEDAEGGVLSFQEGTQGGGSNIESTGHREGDELVTSSRGQVSRYRIPRLAALGPAAVYRLTKAVPLRPGQKFSVNTFESDYPQAPVRQDGTVVGPEIRRIKGVDRKVWKLSITTSLGPTVAVTTWVDEQSNEVESRTAIPGTGVFDEVVGTRAESMQQPEGAELFSTNLIRPSRAIPSPRLQAEASYRITLPHGKEKVRLWNEDEQRVTSSLPGVIEFVVHVPVFSAASATWQLPHADTPELNPYLQPSAYLEINSPEIRDLAHRAVGSEKNPVLAAKRIESFVRSYISRKDLNVDFASAQETARSREGDCTEHALLCAALGRAVGLPTRCVLGLGYIPPGHAEPTISPARGSQTGIFGFHMWAEAYIGPHQWMAMDAALGSFDVGHIAITKTALDEINPLTDLDLLLMQMTQKTDIQLLHVVPKPTVAAPAAPKSSLD